MKRNLEELSAIAVDTGLHIHKDLGPGLLESVYEAVLAEKLRKKGLFVDRQRPIDMIYDDVRIDSAFRVDLLIENRLVNNHNDFASSRLRANQLLPT